MVYPRCFRNSLDYTTRNDITTINAKMEADDGIVRVNLPFVVVTPRHELLLLLLKRSGGVLHETVSAVVLVETNPRDRNGVGSHEKMVPWLHGICCDL
jgi:hypothetical protein